MDNNIIKNCQFCCTDFLNVEFFKLNKMESAGDHIYCLECREIVKKLEDDGYDTSAIKRGKNEKKEE